VAIDPALVKLSNVLATSPSGRETRLPTAVAQLPNQQIWKYDFTYSTWPETGNWTVTINESGFSLPQGTVVGAFPISQGAHYSIAVNWESTENVTTIAGRVSTLESNNVADRTTMVQLRNDLTTTNTQVNTTITNQIAALTTRIDDLEVQVALLAPAP